FDAGLAAHLHRAAPGLEVLLYPANSANGATGGEIRPLYMLHQVVKHDVRVIDLRADRVDNFTDIVRWNICCHANGDACPAVDEEIRKSGWENGRFGPGLVIVRD